MINQISRVLVMILIMNQYIQCLQPCVDPKLLKMYKQYGEYKQYLNEFYRSKCYPIILVPGVMGSRLRVNIDCQNFKQQHPEQFKQCGWNSCKKGIMDKIIGRRAPKDEYNLWVSDLVGPLSVIDVNGKSGHCWNTMISQKVDIKGEKRYISLYSGISVDVYGNTQQTIKDGQCGKLGISNLMELIERHQDIKFSAMCELGGYDNMQKQLESMGYISGLTYQNIPYDFRIPTHFNPFRQYLKNSVDLLYELTNKPITIMAHSLGNIHTFIGLKQFTYEDKQQKIKRWFNIGGPMAGTMKSAKVLLSGMIEYHMESLNLGLSYEEQMGFLRTTSALSETLPSGIWQTQKDQQWMKLLQDRIQRQQIFESSGKYQQNLNNFIDHLLPQPEQQCYNNRVIDAKTKFCYFPFKDLFNKEVIKIVNEQNEVVQSYKADYDDNEQLIEMGKVDQQLTRDLIDNQKNLYEMDNPEIEVVFIYGNHKKTELQYSFQQKSLIDNIQHHGHQFLKPEVLEYTRGDATIPSFSILIPAVKWSYQYQFDNSNNRYKPMKLLEYCADYQYNRDQVNKAINESEVSYNHLKCTCNDHERFVSTATCKHACMHGDQYVVDTVISSIYNEEWKVSEDAQIDVRYTDRELKSILSECPQLKDKYYKENISVDQ